VKLLSTNSIRTVGISKPRKFKPGFEQLEDRRLMSGNSLATSILAPVSPATYSQAFFNAVITLPPAPNVPVAPGLNRPTDAQGVQAIQDYIGGHPELAQPFPAPSPEGIIEPLPGGGLVINLYTSSTMSMVLWSPSSNGAHAVSGAIRDMYVNQLGGPEALKAPSLPSTRWGRKKQLPSRSSLKAPTTCWP
jgi:hypothetical protein